MMLINGCAGMSENSTKSHSCSNEWYALVEKQIPSGDGQGHGPDMGSLEWRSVIEFKLGIRGNATIPPLKSDQWCSYINTRFISQP
ncbi:MAG: hypothetical protein DRQ61_12120 [Gammaproteobacteria bacterium]|nr:MAG: hypothetical protein DRQ61_12120 [Gammaproteobacteria bacterium]